MAFFFRRVKPKDMEIQINMVVEFVDEDTYEALMQEAAEVSGIGYTRQALPPTTFEQEVMQDIADLPGPREWPSP